MKKTLSYTVAGLLILVLITTIVTAVVKSTFYNPMKYYNDEVRAIEVYKGTKRAEYIYEANKETADNAVIKEILRLNDKGFSETVLASFFLGSYSYKTQVTKETQNLNTLILNERNDIFLVIDFTYGYSDNAQNLKLFGEEYKDTNQVKFSKLIFQVKNTSSLDEVVIYLEDNSTSAVGQLSQSLYQVKTLAKQTELYSYLQDLISEE